MKRLRDYCLEVHWGVLVAKSWDLMKVSKWYLHMVKCLAIYWDTLGIDVITYMGSLDRSIYSSNNGKLEGLLLGFSRGSTGGKIIGFNVGIKLISTGCKVLGALICHVDVIIVGLGVGT